MKILWSLVFTATAFCTEVDNSVRLKIDRDCKFYEVKHAGKQYTLPSENINKDEGHISLIFGSDSKNDGVVNINHGFTVNSSIAITCALEALVLVEPSRILDHFFDTDNEHFYDIYNFYNLLVPSNAFKSYFYSVMILKESLHNSDEFNLKAYMFTLDESTLCTPTYKKKIKKRLEEISKVKEEECTAEIREEHLLLVKCKQKKELLCTLVNTYIRSTVLAKIKQRKASLSENQRIDLEKLIKSDATQEKWSDAEIQKLHKSKKYITEDGDSITLDKFTELVKRMLLIYSLERTLNQDKINESMVLNDGAFAFIIEKLSFLQDDILDCSYVPITTLTKNKLWLSDFFGIFNIDFKSMTKVKIFCDLKRLDIGLNIMNTLFEEITVDNDSDSQSVKQNERGYIDNTKEEDLEQNFNNIIRFCERNLKK